MLSVTIVHCLKHIFLLKLNTITIRWIILNSIYMVGKHTVTFKFISLNVVEQSILKDLNTLQSL